MTQLFFGRYLPAYQFLRERAGDADLILIVNPPERLEKHHESCMRMLPRRCRDFLLLEFDDINEPMGGYRAVQPYQVKLALDWAKGRDTVAVACPTGRCRSAALAYAIMAQETSPEAGLALLNPTEHFPTAAVADFADHYVGRGTAPKLGDWLAGAQPFCDINAENIPY